MTVEIVKPIEEPTSTDTVLEVRELAVTFPSEAGDVQAVRGGFKQWTHRLQILADDAFQ